MTSAILESLWSVGVSTLAWVMSSAGVIDTLVGHFRDNVLRESSVFETVIVLDGTFNALKYLKEILLYKMSPNVEDKERKKTLVKNCSRLYRLGYDDRYILYILMYMPWLVYSTLYGAAGAGGTDTATNFFYANMCLMTVPYIQNMMVGNSLVKPLVGECVTMKRLFVKYTLSKTVIRLLGELDPKIIPIQNYQIFALYECLSLQFVYTFVKHYIFVGFLTFLRTSETTYYYYKAIKLSYYYNTGFLFNIVSRKEAINKINKIVKKKEWGSFAQLENVNVLYTLFSQNVQFVNQWQDYYMYFLKIFAVWSAISMMKITNLKILWGTFLGYAVSHFAFGYGTSSQFYSTVIFYTFVSLNINDLIISLLFLRYDLLYTVATELVFFIKNKRNIKKVVSYYASRTQ
jgi:hypothetical protein